LKQRFYTKTAIFIVLALIAVPVLTAQMPQPQPFSADLTVTNPKMSENMTGKMFSSFPKSRIDMNTHGQSVSMIMNSGTQTMYMLMHQQHMYMEMNLNQTNPMARNMPKIDTSFDPKNPCGKNADITCKKSGTETVNGRVCDKYVSTDKSGNVNTAWIDQKLFAPIKAVSHDGSTMELTNIKEGAQPASTFDVPAGYQKMDMGGMMRGQRPPQ
jgi:hypothetical protein